MDIQMLPKIELHFHFDCSLSYAVVQKLAPSISKETYQRDFVAPVKCTNLVDFLTRAPHAIALMQTEEQLRLVVFDIFEQLRQDNIIYAEIRFAPFLHTEQGLSASQVVEIVDSAIEQAIKATGIEVRLLLCTLRHFTAEQSLQTAELVERFRGTRVVGLDIAGDEAGFPLDAHQPAFQYAIQNGLPHIAHAGEGAGPASVWETLQRLQPQRISHGVRSIEDPTLIEYLRKTQLHLEVCPSCNVQINLYDTYADHPIDRLYNLGLSVSVNTDTRTITNVTLTREYERLQQIFGWDNEHFLRCNLNALQASFLPEASKQPLEERLRVAYQ